MSKRMHSKIHAPNLPTHLLPPSGLTKCLICRRILSIGRGIKNHFRIAHIEGGWFEKSFSCPECVHEGRKDVERINGLEAWDDHVERIHGGVQTLAGDVVQKNSGRKRRKGKIATPLSPSTSKPPYCLVVVLDG
jgi:hypothetical protein